MYAIGYRVPIYDNVLIIGPSALCWSFVGGGGGSFWRTFSVVYFCYKWHWLFCSWSAVDFFLRSCTRRSCIPSTLLFVNIYNLLPQGACRFLLVAQPAFSICCRWPPWLTCPNIGLIRVRPSRPQNLIRWIWLNEWLLYLSVCCVLCWIPSELARW